MEDQMAFLISIGIAVLAIGIAIAVSMVSNRRQGELLQEQAQKRNGQLISRGLFSPQMRFPCGDLECLVYMTPGSRNSPPHTHVKVKVSHTLTLSLVSNKFIFGALHRLGGLQELPTYPALGNRFLAKCSDSYFLNTWLTPSVQESLLALFPRSLTVGVRRQVLKFTVTGRLTAAADYDLFLDAVTVLVQEFSKVPLY